MTSDIASHSSYRQFRLTDDVVATMIRSVLARKTNNCRCSLLARAKIHSTAWRGIEWTERGHDITFDALNQGSRPKIQIEGYAPTGFDVVNMVKKIDESDPTESGVLHMNGSILAFPFGCFLWKVETGSDINLDSLAPVFFHQPRLEYLFIGIEGNQRIAAMDSIKMALAKQNCVVEQMSLSNAIGTFNILNAEDRQVAVALVMDREG